MHTNDFWVDAFGDTHYMNDDCSRGSCDSFVDGRLVSLDVQFEKELVWEELEKDDGGHFKIALRK